MTCKPDGPVPFVLGSKPSSSFSSVSSAGSATSAATARSGGSRLLFGEIDTNSDRSSESYASVCSFVLCDSSTFLKFWLEDRCRETFLSSVPKNDLANLRLACHDFSVRAAPSLFSDLKITFRASSFTKPSKLAALDRLGYFVKVLRFNIPHSTDTFLAPLIEPDTGAELSFSYTPEIQDLCTTRRPKYGDPGTTEILTRQYPPTFHAATNVPAFIRALSSFINLEHLAISCPNYDPSQRYRRSIVDYALISLRIAVERNCFNALDTLTLSPIHPGGIMHLSPILGYGASPKSARSWSRIHHLTIHTYSTLVSTDASGEPDHFKLLQTYLRNFQSNLETFNFRWIDQKGLLPVKSLAAAPPLVKTHPAHAAVSYRKTTGQTPIAKSLYFPKIKRVEIENVSTAASDISAFVATHKGTIEELNLGEIVLTHGTWDDALAPFTSRPNRRKREEHAEIPIMLSPTAGAQTGFPAPMERLEVAHVEVDGRKSLRMSKWLSSKSRKPTAAWKVREGLLECEEQLKKVLRGSVFQWR